MLYEKLASESCYLKSPSPTSGFLPHLYQSSTLIYVEFFKWLYLHILPEKNYCYSCPKIQQAASEVVHSRCSLTIHSATLKTGLLGFCGPDLGQSLEVKESCSVCHLRSRSELTFSWHPISFPNSIPVLDDFPGISM